MISLLKISFLKKSLLLIFSFFLIFSIPVYNQTTEISIQHSNEKVLINGKIYFIHIVKKGQTLYSIAKAYSVTVNDITSVNPNAVIEIVPGQVLRIPEASKKASTVDFEKSSSRITHIVSAGQTLYSIARIYGVSVDDIKKLNPEIKSDSLKVDQVIKIPSPALPEAKIKQDTLLSGFVIHIVREKETIYSLARQYGVTQDTLLYCNATVSKEGLKIGQELKIPVIRKQIAINRADTISKVISNNIPFNASINCDSIQNLHKEKNLTISLLLPFFSSGTPVTDSETGDENRVEERAQPKQTDEISHVADNFIEFYQGVLLALENLKNTGLKINLHVFDTEKSTGRLDAILNNTGFKESDIIIGPVFPDQVKIVSDFAQKNKIFLISPFSSNDEALKTNPFMFQVNPGKRYEMKTNAEILNPDTSKNIIIVYNSNDTKTQQGADFNALLNKKQTEVKLRIKEVSIEGNNFGILKDALDSLHENIVISTVTDEIFVSKMLGILESKLIENNISITGMREWDFYTGLDLNYFFDLQLSYLSPFYTDYECSDVKEFLSKYRLFYGAEPVKTSKFGFNYSMLGYDVTTFFANAYSKYGREFNQCLSCIKYKALVAPFEFIRPAPEGGYLNSHFLKVQYNKDYSVERVKVPEK